MFAHFKRLISRQDQTPTSPARRQHVWLPLTGSRPLAGAGQVGDILTGAVHRFTYVHFFSVIIFSREDKFFVNENWLPVILV